MLWQESLLFHPSIYMKRIQLTQGKYTIVDNEDFEYLNQFNWHFDGFYAGRNIRVNNNKTRIRMHREVAKTPKGYVTDHLNGDKLDNRKGNLKICTQSENQKRMKKFTTNKTGVSGVHWDKSRQKFLASKCFNGKRTNIGRFDSLIKAKKAYEKFVTGTTEEV